MRRGARVVLAVFLTTIPAAAPAHQLHRLGEPTPVVFQDALPCAAICAYWLDELNCDIDIEECEPYLQACDAPFPPESWDDIEIVAPPGARVLEARIDPVVEWDLFLCGPDGEQLAVGGSRYPELCDHEALPLGCRETIYIVVQPGQSIVLRAYNWADPFPAPGSYTFWGYP